MQLDFISDTHVDFFAQVPLSPDVKDMLPDSLGRVLVIAGDIGHCNEQNANFVAEMRKFYQDVIVVRGNHDLYITRNEIQDFNKSSKNRWEDMMMRYRQIPGVHCLDGDIVEIDGVKIGGCGMWCDGSYAAKYFKVTPVQLKFMHYRFSDHKFIHDFGEIPETFKTELDKMEKIFDDCDVIVSHYGPDASQVPLKHHNPFTGFFYFDGKDLLARGAGKTWIYGHTHDAFDYIAPGGCHLVCNPYGYPPEQRAMGSKIKSLTIQGNSQP